MAVYLNIQVGIRFILTFLFRHLLSAVGIERWELKSILSSQDRHTSSMESTIVNNDVAKYPCKACFRVNMSWVQTNWIYWRCDAYSLYFKLKKALLCKNDKTWRHKVTNNSLFNFQELSFMKSKLSRAVHCTTQRAKFMGPTWGPPAWVMSVPDGPHDGPMNLAIRVSNKTKGTRIHVCP